MRLVQRDAQALDGASAGPELTAADRLGDAIEHHPREKLGRRVAAGERRLSHRAFQAALFINLYRDAPALQEPFRLLMLLMDIDQGFTTWRYRHALMTQRMIGRRVGTGGSAGASYLRSTLDKRLFPELWSLRTEL